MGRYTRRTRNGVLNDRIEVLLVMTFEPMRIVLRLSCIANGVGSRSLGNLNAASSYRAKAQAFPLDSMFCVGCREIMVREATAVQKGLAGGKLTNHSGRRVPYQYEMPNAGESKSMESGQYAASP